MGFGFRGRFRVWGLGTWGASCIGVSEAGGSSEGRCAVPGRSLKSTIAHLRASWLPQHGSARQE